MTLARGFLSEDHAESFAARRQDCNRGSGNQLVCGARTRGGGACQQPPLTGHTRCLRHAGPKAARALRERQIVALAAGRMSPAEFERHELRRSANRLRDAWKRDPWAPGQTIDLGVHEDRFQTESGLARLDQSVAPAVVDWLRWRYRRLQIDRRRDDEWARVVLEEYPRRVRKAGMPPPGYDPSATGSATRVWLVGEARRQSKRSRGDARRRAAATERRPHRVPSPRGAGHSSADESRLALVAYEQRDVLAPLLDLCADEDEQRALVRTLADYLDQPANLDSMHRWIGAVSELRARTAVC